MKSRKTSAFKLENLEPRLLFSSGTTVAAVDCEIMPVDSAAVLQLDLAAEAQSAEHADMQSIRARELILIDGSVNDPLHLIEELQSPTDDNQHYAYYILDSQKDGIEQVSEILERYQGVSAVHLISHGAEGQIDLGNTSLTSDNLNQYAAQIEGWQQSLTEQADLLFYGCNLAQGEAGQSLLQGLQKLTAADIAASDDLTGSESLGGDWQLEYASGTIEARVAVNDAVQSSWAGTLAVTTGSSDSAATSSAANNLTFSHSVNSGSDRLLVVEVATANNEVVSSVTYGGTPLTFYESIEHSSAEARVELWFLK